MHGANQRRRFDLRNRKRNSRSEYPKSGTAITSATSNKLRRESTTLPSTLNAKKTEVDPSASDCPAVAIRPDVINDFRTFYGWRRGRVQRVVAKEALACNAEITRLRSSINRTLPQGQLQRYCQNHARLRCKDPVATLQRSQTPNHSSGPACCSGCH
jgi:hypothetical protein